MLINEVLSTPVESNLLTALQLLKMRYANTDGPAKINTNALINMIINTDRNFDYDALVDSYNTDPAIKNMISSFNEKEITLNTGNDKQEKPDMAGAEDAPVNTVSGMAKRAAKHRGAPVK